MKKAKEVKENYTALVYRHLKYIFQTAA